MNGISMWISIKIEKCNRRSCGRLGRCNSFCSTWLGFMQFMTEVTHKFLHRLRATRWKWICGPKLLLNFTSQNVIKQCAAHSINPLSLINSVNLFTDLSRVHWRFVSSRRLRWIKYSSWFKSLYDKESFQKSRHARAVELISWKVINFGALTGQ